MRIFNYIIEENEDEIRDELHSLYIQEYDDWSEDEINDLIDQKIEQIKHEIGKII